MIKRGFMVILLIGVLGIVIGIVSATRLFLRSHPVADDLQASTSTQANPTSTASDSIHVRLPASHAHVSSPIHIEGEARNGWYFEATFPIRLLDAHEGVLGSTVAHSQTEWTKEGWIPFSADLSFSMPFTPTGTLIFEKDNPSGLPENDEHLLLPVTFSF